MRKAAIYDPYLDSLGGGERYSLFLASVLRDLGWKVELLWSGDSSIVQQAEKRFNLDLNEIVIHENFFSDTHMSKFFKSKNYDLIFFVSDGSIPLLLGKVNWLHFQVPFHDVKGKSLKNKFKLGLIKRVIANSKFTKSFVDREFGISSQVIYPPVDTKSIIPLKKDKTILYVGRFSQLLQQKGQDILIKTFKHLVENGHSDWKMVLAGSSDVGFASDEKNRLQSIIKNFPITLEFNPSFKRLQELYGKSLIFWAAGGFGFDPTLHPEKMEHFGITIVEAMAAKTVPLAVNLGGFPEILTSKLADLLWESTDELSSKTLKLITNSKNMLKFQNLVSKRALEFSSERFRMTIKEAINYDFPQG